MNILKSFFGTPQYVSQTDTTPDGPDPDPEDIWAFTDPDARMEFESKGKLEELKHDIRFEVMRGESWFPEELEYKRGIQRLLRSGAVVDKGMYWFTSPFPTVYQSIRDGSLNIGGREYRFSEGDDIVFQCRMNRDMDRSLKGPVLVARLQPTSKAQLCGEMGGAMKGMQET